MISNDWKHLFRTETSQKSFTKAFSYYNKVTKSLIKSLEDFQSSLIKKFISPFYLSLKNTIFSVLISAVKLLLIHNWFKKCWWMDSYICIFSILYKLIHFSSLKPCSTQNEQHTKYSVSWMERTKRVSILIYILLHSFQNFSRLLISSDWLLATSIWNTLLISLSELLLKIIIMRTSSRFHDGAQLKFYSHLVRRYCTPGLCSRNLCQGLGAPLYTITETLVIFNKFFLD